eukprot:TRINITY_DN34860_c1_g1_i1.p3 TRINITY_DN34860_c1_g1~~TRINITY_DN34860_c1_g1_i1.p3  ORF type:complete len:137 (-),score=17.14 TRINITY_DN34860_c1_g1_i1:184-594(-)
MDVRDSGGRYRFNIDTFNNVRNIKLQLQDENDKENGREWNVVLLGKGSKKCDPPTGYGLSGGWRSVAVDKFLYPEDRIAMWRIADDKIAFRPFRAFHYDKSVAKGWKPGMKILSEYEDEQNKENQGNQNQLSSSEQ